MLAMWGPSLSWSRMLTAAIVFFQLTMSYLILMEGTTRYEVDGYGGDYAVALRVYFGETNVSESITEKFHAPGLSDPSVYPLRYEVVDNAVAFWWAPKDLLESEIPGYRFIIYRRSHVNKLMEFETTEQTAFYSNFNLTESGDYINVDIILMINGNRTSERRDMIGVSRRRDQAKVYASLNKTRPRCLTIVWNATVKSDLQLFSNLFYIGRMREDKTKELTMFMNTSKQIGRTTYNVDNDASTYVVVLKTCFQKDCLKDWRSNTVEVPSILEVTVKNLEYAVIGSEVIFSWETVGTESGEFVTYYTSVYINDEGPRVFKSDKPHLRLNEANRPLAIRLKIAPKIGAYYGLAKEFEVKLAEEVPTSAPENMTVVVYSPVEVYFYFDPVPTDEVLGKSKGCEVNVCETKSYPPICTSKLVPPGENEVFFTELLHGKSYHATAACLTGAGAGPSSPWITFRTLQPSPKTAKDRTKRPPLTQPHPKDIGVRVNINIREEMTVVISWGFVMDDGSAFDQEMIKDLQVMLYKKDGEHYKNAGIITKDKNQREIDIGLSPNYLFDTNCYFYAVNVTFKNKRRLFEPSNELCYTMTSPSFLMSYAFIALIFLIIAAVVFITLREKRKAPPPPKQKDDKKPAEIKLKPGTARQKFGDELKPTKVKPTAQISSGSRESFTGSGEAIDTGNAPPWVARTKSKEESKQPKIKPVAPITRGSRESVSGSGESVDARNAPPYFTKTRSKEESEPPKLKPMAPIFILRPRAPTGRNRAPPWDSRPKSNEGWKVMKLRPLAQQSGSHESI